MNKFAMVFRCTKAEAMPRSRWAVRFEFVQVIPPCDGQEVDGPSTMSLVVPSDRDGAYVVGREYVLTLEQAPLMREVDRSRLLIEHVPPDMVGDPNSAPGMRVPPTRMPSDGSPRSS